MSRILVVEDERNVGSTLVERLHSGGYDVEWATTGARAREAIRSGKFDLALLDVGLPDDSGFDIAAALRDESPSTAMIFLTAWGAPDDRIRGLELGAEDYVTKPFHLKELLLRIANVLKRASSLNASTESTRVGRAEIRFSSFEAVVDGKPVALTHKECALLRLLALHRGEALSRDRIISEVWGDNEFPTTRTVDNFISRLRKLVEENPEKPAAITSVRGVGYKLI